LPLLDESPPVEIVLLARDGRRPALEEIVEVARGDGLVVGTWRESAGLDVVALQALACGRAAVLGDGPAYRDLDPRRRASLAVPAGDAGALRAAVRALRDDPALRARLGEEGRRLASSPTLHRCGELLVEVLSAAQKRQTLLDAWHRAPWPAAPSDRGDDGDDARRHQWEVEQELARRLRRATPTERRQLYSLAYDELFRRVPKQPQLEQARDHAARSALVDLQLRLVAPFVGPSTVFLEIGAGDCAFARALCPRVRRVHAVEASRAIEQNGSGDAPPNLHFAVADLPPLPVADDSVDVAYSSHVVEHLHPDDLAPHLEDVLRILVPGGLYLCVTPNRLLGPHDVSRYFADRACGLHLREYTHHELGRAMHRAGFTPVRALRRLGDEPARGRLAVVELVERALALAPARLRRRLLSGVGRREPFRPLEQVKLVAWKPAR
jgi:SAM-dependent methyltransferase